MLRQLFLLFQLVVSARPGLVDIVDGDANVRQYEHISAGRIIQTGANSHVEFSLGWEAYLRLEERSAAVMESADRKRVAVRIDSGSALIEVIGINKGSEIVVTAGNLKTTIDSKGVFRFSTDTVQILRGKLKTLDKSLEIGDGWQLVNSNGTYQKTKLAMEIPPPLKRFMGGPKGGFVNPTSRNRQTRRDWARKPRGVATCSGNVSSARRKLQRAHRGGYFEKRCCPYCVR
jgi:hypothetical protein